MRDADMNVSIYGKNNPSGDFFSLTLGIWEISFRCSSWNSLWQGELTHLHRSQEGNVNPIRKIIYHQKIIIVEIEKESFWGKFTE